MKSKRTKACEIKPKVREAVEKRDSINGVPCCIFCGRPKRSEDDEYVRGEAHFIKRSQGGLGIEQNIVTACRWCHHQMDDGNNRALYINIAANYLKEHYPDWNVSDLVYKKGFEYD